MCFRSIPTNDGADNGGAGNGTEVSRIDGCVRIVSQNPVMIVAEAIAVGGTVVEIEATGAESGSALSLTEEGVATEAEGEAVNGIVRASRGENEPEPGYLVGRRDGEEHAWEELADAADLRVGEREAEVSRVVGLVADGDVEGEEEAEEREAEVARDAVGVENVCGCGVETTVYEVAIRGDGDSVAGQAHATAEVQGVAVLRSGTAIEDDGPPTNGGAALIYRHAIARTEGGLHGACGYGVTPDPETPYGDGYQHGC